MRKMRWPYFYGDDCCSNIDCQKRFNTGDWVFEYEDDMTDPEVVYYCSTQCAESSVKTTTDNIEELSF